MERQVRHLLYVCIPNDRPTTDDRSVISIPDWDRCIRIETMSSPNLHSARSSNPASPCWNRCCGPALTAKKLIEEVDAELQDTAHRVFLMEARLSTSCISLGAKQSAKKLCSA